MKTHIIIIVAAIFAVGCSHKPDARDAKIAKLESRVSDIEARCELLSSSFTNLLSIVQRANAQDAEDYAKLETLVKSDNDNWNSLIQVFSALTNAPPKQVAAPRPYYPAQPQPSAYATRDGVPIGIYNQIAANAAAKWPSDYDMQAYEIKNQVEAYRKIHQ